MATPDLEPYPHLFIGGRWAEPADGAHVDSIDPATGRPWARVAFAGPGDVDRAVAAAREAFAGPWRRLPGHERAALLRRFAELYQRHAPQLARIESRDNGRALRESRVDVGAHHQWLHWYASLADKLSGRTIPFDDSVHVFTSRLPVGVVAAITPWNVPLMSAIWKLAPALAAGCTVILKPAEHTPVSSLELARLVEAAGFPPGVVNVIPGGPEAGAALVAHPGVDKISFTGEGATAKAILRNGADTLKRFSFELGGKAPHIIFADADIEQALNAATGSAWALCGQSCALGSRVLVERPVYDRVVEEFARRAAKVRVGMPLDEATHMGPQAHAAQLEKTLSYVGIALGEGAELVAGGTRLDDGVLAGGYFVAPTVFANVNNDMRVAREEIFGPVAALIPFEGEEEAVALANATEYGLAAGLWTGDASRAHRVAARIEAGIVWVNTYRFLRWSTPYGGMKHSGWGRENGLEGLDAYLETRTTVVSTTGRFPDPYAQ
ncbi:aldehyde dehydrogenase [Pseudoxanthomonas broegbernensis]|uniref:Aldehyde dehydrogenase n=1 Tax=Pseudoxanthomonas broegbernensis TaxID=83619 RepID=A0A7V8GMW2_9GAMM|nr:aldehyde dehydrogenase [Pseudoxanthomonas broegbernensis]KAF1686724.1 aldehyde dehydrogenase [Pseudoxanthomonas broegbernensis]MBB6063509.1 aldehyde dehydrogenase (NAD+) [Pseudoxanthomonas broegbernensis]